MIGDTYKDKSIVVMTKDIEPLDEDKRDEWQVFRCPNENCKTKPSLFWWQKTIPQNINIRCKSCKQITILK